MGILGILLPALLPVAADGISTLMRWMFGSAVAEPINVKERVELMQAETDKLRVIAELDRPAENISLWVANLRASFRYIAAGAIILIGSVTVLLNGAGVTAVPDDVIETMLYMNGSVFSFMFGDRMYLQLKGISKGKKG